jgi:hypothetical protein
MSIPTAKALAAVATVTTVAQATTATRALGEVADDVETPNGVRSLAVYYRDALEAAVARGDVRACEEAAAAASRLAAGSRPERRARIGLQSTPRGSSFRFNSGADGCDAGLLRARVGVAINSGQGGAG